MLKQWMNNRRKKKAELLLQSLDTNELAEALVQHIDYDVLARKTKVDYGVLAYEVVDHLDLDDVVCELARNFDADDIARQVDLYDVAYNLDMDDLAGHIDMDDLARNVNIDMDELACNHIDMDDLASYLDMGELVERLDLREMSSHVADLIDTETIAERFDLKELAACVTPDAVAEALASASAALADDRLTAMVDCLSSMAEAIGLAVTEMQMSIKED
jgi:hypothetical protein